MYNKILKTSLLHNMISNGDTIILGLSGGADSVLLFHFLCHIKDDYNLNLICVHINHGLRGFESDLDERFVVELCQSFNIKSKVFKIDITQAANDLKISTEEAGRLKRYQAFQSVLKKEGGTKIAVAHNKNDNAETVLMRVFRGTGLKGLCGIPFKRDNIIRPLMNTSRGEIENFCEQKSIIYRTDKTNYESVYTRNKIRNEMLPYIMDNFNEDIINTLAKMAQQLNDENSYLEDIANEELKNAIIESESELKIKLDQFCKQHTAIKSRIMRLAIYKFSNSLKDISSEHIERIVNLSENATGKQIVLPNSVVVKKDYDVISFKMQSNQLEHSDFCYKLYFEQSLFIKELNKYILISRIKFKFSDTNICTKTFCCDKIIETFNLRTRQAGDKIFIKTINGNKKIKNYFIDEKVPRDKRNTIPLLALESDILWIIDEKGITSDRYKESYIAPCDMKDIFYVYLYSDSNLNSYVD